MPPLAAATRRRKPEQAMELVRAYRFPHVNMDLIAGLPEDTPEGFRRSLDKCLELGASNITVHTLALKKGSRILTRGPVYSRRLCRAGHAGLCRPHPAARRVRPLLPLPAEIYVRQL